MSYGCASPRSACATRTMTPRRDGKAVFVAKIGRHVRLDAHTLRGNADVHVIRAHVLFVATAIAPTMP